MLSTLKKTGKIFYDQAVKLKWSEKINLIDNKSYNTILKNGIIKLENNFEKFASYINQNYIENILKEDLKISSKVLDIRNSNKNNLVNHLVGLTIKS